MLGACVDASCVCAVSRNQDYLLKSCVVQFRACQTISICCWGFLRVCKKVLQPDRPNLRILLSEREWSRNSSRAAQLSMNMLGAGCIDAIVNFMCGPYLFVCCWDVQADRGMHVPRGTSRPRPEGMRRTRHTRLRNGWELCFVAHFLGCRGDMTKACQGARGVLRLRLLTCEGGSQQQSQRC